MNQMKQTDNRLWTKFFIIIILFNLCVGISHNMLMTILPLYAVKVGGDDSTAGIIVGAFSIAALVVRPLFGAILDTRGRKGVLVFGSVLFLITIILQGFVPTVFLLVVLRIVQGIGFSATSTAAGTVVADLIPSSRLSEGIGFFGITLTIAIAIGPAWGLHVIKSSYLLFFIIAAAAVAIAIGIVQFLNYEKSKKKPADHVVKNEKAKSEKIFSMEKIYEKSALPSTIVLLFIAFALGSILTFLPLFAQSRGIENIGIFFTVYAFAVLVSRLMVGRLADRIGVSPVIIPAFIIFAASLCILAFAKSLCILVLAAVLYGLGFGTAQPLVNTITIKLSPVEKRGTANAMLYSAMDIGIGVGAIVWGLVAKMAGYTYVYLAASGCVITAMFLYIILFCNKKADRLCQTEPSS